MLQKATEVHRLTFTGILNDSSLFTPKDLTQIGFVIQNKTDFGIKIDWDDISIIFPGRIASRVIHGGTKLIDRNAAQAQTTVPPSAKIIDSLVPSDHISFTQGQYGGWETAPLFGGEDRLIWNNKEFSIFFPLEINGKK